MSVVNIQLEELNFENLAKLGGGVAVAQVMRLLQSAVSDITQRPGDDRSRKVILGFELIPVAENEADEDEGTIRKVVTGVKMRLHMDLKIPNRKTTEYDLGIGAGNSLLFNPDSPHNHRQQVFSQVLEGSVREVLPIHAG